MNNINFFFIFIILQSVKLQFCDQKTNDVFISRNDKTKTTQLSTQLLDSVCEK